MLHITKEGKNAPYKVKIDDPNGGIKTLFEDRNIHFALAYAQGVVDSQDDCTMQQFDLYHEYKMGHRATGFFFRHTGNDEFQEGKEKKNGVRLESLIDVIAFCEKQSRTASFRITFSLNASFYAFNKKLSEAEKIYHDTCAKYRQEALF
ncbi:MAG: hypothetical protein HYV45_01925 [Candidatus Moranbacteria bacterium]|nr:hypothetical protein [Candidatus Moranbacteria bacterium]